MFQRQKGKLHQNQRRRPPLQRRGRRPTANIRNKLLRADHFTSYVGADMHQSANLAVQHEPKPERALGAKPARPLLTHRSMRRLSRAAHGVIPFTQKTGRRGGGRQARGKGREWELPAWLVYFCSATFRFAVSLARGRSGPGLILDLGNAA